MYIWSTGLQLAPADAIIIAADRGDVWSPKVAPARIAPIIGSNAGIRLSFCMIIRF